MDGLDYLVSLVKKRDGVVVVRKEDEGYTLNIYLEYNFFQDEGLIKKIAKAANKCDYPLQILVLNYSVTKEREDLIE